MRMFLLSLLLCLVGAPTVLVVVANDSSPQGRPAAPYVGKGQGGDLLLVPGPGGVVLLNGSDVLGELAQLRAENRQLLARLSDLESAQNPARRQATIAFPGGETTMYLGTTSDARGWANKLEGYTAIEGDVSVRGATAQTLRMVFENITTMYGSLTVIESEGLTDLEGLAGLQAVHGDFTVTGYPDAERRRPLVAVTLAALRHVGGTFEISDMKNVETIALGVLTRIGAGLKVVKNDALLSINISSVEQVGGDIDCSSNIALIKLAAPK